MADTATRNYNIDEFDWGGEEDTVRDQEHVEKVESLIRLALAETAPVEDSWLRPSAVDNDRARVVYNVPYTLDAIRKEHMQELVGEVRTLTFNAREYHDHPVSHCLTEISEDMVVRKFGKEPFVSVWGNASRHRRLGHTGAKTVSNRVVPHDWFRNRGMEETVTSVDSFIEARGHLRYRIFLATHALYYMSLEEVACWLGGNPDAEFYAIVHRHNKSSGHLNKGELKYTVDSSGIVTQVNPATGFSYTHRSMEPLFHVDSCRLFEGKVGLAWDVNRLAGDNYLVKFVLCGPQLCKRIVDPWELIKSDREVTIRGDVTVYRMLGYEWYVYHSANGQICLEDAELYDRLRRTIAGKERTPRTKSDLTAMCRRLANKNDIISIHQGFHHEVDPGSMMDYVNAAFYADVKYELEIALKFHRENRDAVETLNKFLIEGKVPTDLTHLATVGRAVKTPFNVLSGLLRNQSERMPSDIVSALPLSVMSQIPPDPFRIRKAPDKVLLTEHLRSVGEGLALKF